MERITVKARDGFFCGVVQTLRAEGWKDALVLMETRSKELAQACWLSARTAGEVNCPVVLV